MQQPHLSFFRLRLLQGRGCLIHLCVPDALTQDGHTERAQEILFGNKISFHLMTSDIAFPNDLTAAAGAGRNHCLFLEAQEGDASIQVLMSSKQARA